MADGNAFGMTGMPGSNPSGGQMAVPTPASQNTPAIGGNDSPFAPTPPTGQQTPGISSSIATAGPIGPSSAANNLATTNPSSLWGLGAGDPNAAHNFVKSMGKAGFSSGVAGQLWNFINSGAGFNPQVAEAMIAAMQPGVQRKEADIMEQFSGLGMRGGSPAAIATGDFLAQEQLNEGQIWAQMYEQSVSNYMNVLLAGKGNPPKSLFDNIMTGISTMSGAAESGAKAAASGGTSGGLGGNI